jgi:hypothetical protein
MNKHLNIIISELMNEMDFEYSTEHGNEDTYFIILHSWEDRDKFVDRCREYINDEDAPDYQIEREFDCELVFDDEYTTCNDCGGIIRTSPDSYHWMPDYHIGDGYIVCNQCFNDNEDYQEEYINDKINNYQNANQLLSNEQIEALGFKRVGEHEYMMGEDTTDTPKRLYYALEEQYEDILFSIDGVGQFNTDYSVWVRGEK